MARKIALLGDSHLAFGFTAVTATGMRVDAGGRAIFTFAGNHNCMPGNYVFLYATGDPLCLQPLAGACVRASPPVTGISSNSVLVVDATFNGQTMAPGEYGALTWVALSLTQYTDSSWFTAIQNFTGHYFELAAVNALVGLNTAGMVAMVPKILAGPYCDSVFVTCGANDRAANGGTQANSLEFLYQAFYKARKQIIEPFINAGKYVYFCPPPPLGSPTVDLTIRNVAFTQYRQLFVELEKEYSDYMQIVDVHGLGMSTSGDAVTPFIFTDGIHVASAGNLTIARGVKAQFPKSTYKSPISVTQDNNSNAQQMTAWAANTTHAALPVTRRRQTRIYALLTPGTTGPVGPLGTGSSIPDGTCVWAFVCDSQVNLLDNGLMSGTAGTNSSAVLTGNVPTSWRANAASAGMTGTMTSAQARQNISNTNGAALGFGWNFALLFSAANDSFNFQVLANLGPRFDIPGWYQAGITVTATNDWVNMKSFALTMACSGITTVGTMGAGIQGNNTTTLPMLTSDTIDLLTPPVYIGADGAIASGSYVINLIAAGAGQCNFQVSNAFLWAVPDPHEVRTNLEQRQPLNFNATKTVYAIP